jgi:hypothetical protein
MTGIVAAIGLAVDLLSGIISLTAQLQKVSALIAQAQAENRDITPEELDALKAERLAARQKALDA